MVIENGFEFQIVSAHDKTPFKEHKKGLKTYVEVEPDAEYFISIRGGAAPKSDVYMTYKVDGNFLSRSHAWRKSSSPRPDALFIGIGFMQSSGIRTFKALKFVNASFRSEHSNVNPTNAGMGKIEIYIYQAIFTGISKHRERREPPVFTEPTIVSNADDIGPLTIKKNVRSGKGRTSLTSTYDPNELCRCYGAGKLLYTVTLHYCTTPGLIAVGVLPKPPMWGQQRKMNPSNLTAREKKRLEKSVVSVKRNRKGNEVIQLTDTEGSDNDEDCQTLRRPSKHLKPSIDNRTRSPVSNLRLITASIRDYFKNSRPTSPSNTSPALTQL